MKSETAGNLILKDLTTQTRASTPPTSSATRARNEEKALFMMNRWTSMKEDLDRGPRSRRPILASECKDLAECEKWRRSVIKDVSRAVSKIQDASLGEGRLRDLNDDINKLMATCEQPPLINRT